MPAKLQKMTAQLQQAADEFAAAERDCLALGPFPSDADANQLETDLHQAIEDLKF
jgi:hypothetical protein